ncbi:MAG: pyruvate synthase [Chloroflexi bacterium]|nr:pyruvate synthase [Chloroflexota bacterium]
MEQIKGVKTVPLNEYYMSGHRTCQGCEPALAMKLTAKAIGPRSIVLGATGCMYVANTSYYTTPWAIPWMHTQLGAAGSAALGTSAGLKALMRKGKLKEEHINVVAICGDGGGADMGVSAISATLTHPQYDSLIVMYDNESYANTDVQASGSTPWGAVTRFTPSGTVHRITQTRIKKNMVGMLAAGHPGCKYVATVCPSFAVDMMQKIRKAIAIGGPTFVHCLTPCPKGWGFAPDLSHEMGIAAVETGVWPLYEIEDGMVRFNGRSKTIAEGGKREPVGEYTRRQDRFAHFTAEDTAYFQGTIDEMWQNWLVPAVIPLSRAAQ